MTKSIDQMIRDAWERSQFLLLRERRFEAVLNELTRLNLENAELRRLVTSLGGVNDPLN